VKRKEENVSILKVARLGHPILRQVAGPVPDEAFNSLEVRCLIRDMVETMREYEGVGLAAPQVHESMQIIVIEVNQNPRYPLAPEIPLVVLTNLVITPLTKEKVEDWEGCLSVPDLRGKVPRYRQIEVQARDASGKEITLSAQNFFARVIQHEYDHLAGKVFLDHMSSNDTLSYSAEYIKYWEEK